MFVVPVSSSLHRRAFGRTIPFASTRADADESRAPRVDVIETDASYSVVLDMPGIAKDQLDVSVDGRHLKVSAKAATVDAQVDDKRRILYRERGTAPFARSVTLPDEVDNAQSQARLENGVLTLTLAKRSAARAIQIQVN
jgi:HSP20 family protein